MAAVTDRLRLASGTAEVLAALRRSLTGDGVTAPIPPTGVERDQTLVMFRPSETVAEPDAAAIVATSGSTGHPRGVVLSRAALIASAAATHRRLGGLGTWVLALPAHYVAGLMVLVRGLLADQPVREVDPHLNNVADLDLGGGPSYISLVPTQLTRALADPARTAALRRFDAILLGGAASDPGLLELASAARLNVVTSYGMSETCGGCVYDGVPLDGVEVTADQGGRLSIAGPVLFAGYRLDPAATAETLVGGRLLTRDRGLIDRGRVSVLGRLDDVVVSGGMNVDLAAVERAVRGRLGEESAVIGIPHRDWGTEVVVVVGGGGNAAHVASTPRKSRAATGTWTANPSSDALANLRRALATELPAYALPRRLVWRATLPRTAGGKIDRRRLVAELSTAEPEDEP